MHQANVVFEIALIKLHRKQACFTCSTDAEISVHSQNDVPAFGNALQHSLRRGMLNQTMGDDLLPRLRVCSGSASFAERSLYCLFRRSSEHDYRCIGSNNFAVCRTVFVVFIGVIGRIATLVFFASCETLAALGSFRLIVLGLFKAPVWKAACPDNAAC